MPDRAHADRQRRIDGLAASAQRIGWDFAYADAIEAGREAEHFCLRELAPLGAREDLSEPELVRLAELQGHYFDLARHSRRLMDALLLRPAPTRETLLWKMEYALGGKRGLGTGESLSADAMRAIAEDARRLLGPERLAA